MAADADLILLTGASGFVGRKILDELLSMNCRIRLVSRPDHPISLPADKTNVEVVETQDLFAESNEWLQDLCSGCTKVIHAAWYAEPGKYLTSPLNLDCLTGTVRPAQAFAASGGRRFIGIGTCFEYDLEARVLNTDTPLRPQTLYAACKASAFQILSTLLSSLAVEFVWCRLFYLYGDGENARRLVPYLREKLASGEAAELTSGRQVRDFLDVCDAAKMIVEAAFGDQQGPANICSGVPITVRQLAERIADEYGRRDLLMFGARPDGLTDPPCVLGTR